MLLRLNMSGQKPSRLHGCLLWECGALTHLSVLLVSCQGRKECDTTEVT